MKITFSNHALKRMELRNITQKTVVEIVENPDSVISRSEGIRVFSKFIKEETNFIFTEYL